MKLHQAWILFVLSIGLGFSNPAEAASALLLHKTQGRQASFSSNRSFKGFADRSQRSVLGFAIGHVCMNQRLKTSHSIY